MTKIEAKSLLLKNKHLKGTQHKGKQIAELMMCHIDAENEIINEIISKSINYNSYDQYLSTDGDFKVCVILEYELAGTTLFELQILDNEIAGFRV